MPTTNDALPKLTPRETQVLQGVWDGFQNKHIAQQLKLSIKTVEVHRANLMKKLRVHHTAPLLRLAVRHKLVKG
jgi:DNA-binding NarL/FixJ family response regulator